MNIPQKTRIGAYAIITLEKQLLLCRLSKEVPALEGKWILPGGGIEFGETPTDAMVREVLEETGLEVIPKGLADVHSYVIETEKNIQQNIRIIYFAEIIGGNLRHETTGSTDLCQWCDLDNLPPLMDLGEHGVLLARSFLHSIKIGR